MSGRFKRGDRKRGGRKRGTPNKVTGELREMVLAALSKAGGVEYLVRQARRKNPAPFMALLGKVLPLRVTGGDGGPLKVEVIDYAARAGADDPPPA